MTASATATRTRNAGPVLDLQAALSPAGGLVAAHAVAPPALTGGLWQVTARLRCAHSEQPWSTELQSCVTGACSLTRREALLRAVGESVERMALHPAEDPEGPLVTPAEAGPRAVRLHRPDGDYADPDPDQPTRWYAGRAGSEQVLVPAALVEYPVTGAGFDAGPSGAAAGLGRTAALRSALLEVVERDALIVGWARRQQTRVVDLDDLLARAADAPDWAPVRRLRTLITERGLTPVLAEVGLSVPGLVCVVGGVLAQTTAGPAYCLGTKVSDDPARAVRGALEESLQLAPGLIELRERRAGQPAPAVVRDDNERLEFLASDRGAASVADWLRDPAPATLPLALPPVGTDEVLARTVADGLEPVVVDLGHRLPERARAAGWSVVKVLPLGYQPLRIDERTRFGWNTSRLRTAPDRTGLPARVPAGQVHPDPHPLP